MRKSPGRKRCQIASLEQLILLSGNPVTGTAGPDWIAGTDLDDAISALGGDDNIHAPVGNNLVDGGEGIDTLVIYEGVSTEYEASLLENGNLQLTGPGLNEPEINYELVNVERVAFTDATLDVDSLIPDTPDPDPDQGSVIEIYAWGDVGTEDFEVTVNGIVVGSFTSIGTTPDVYRIELADTIDSAIDIVRVQFTNDFYAPLEGIDANLNVDRIVLDGRVAESEDPSTISTGSLGIQGETLFTNGYFEYSFGVDPDPDPDPAGSVLEVFAWGAVGTEDFEVTVNDIVVGSFSSIGTTPDVYRIELADTIDSAIDIVRVQFTNDFYAPLEGIDANLNVDRIVLDGRVAESEDPSTISTGSLGIQGETLFTNGYFEYSFGVDPDPDPDPDPPQQSTLNGETIYRRGSQLYMLTSANQTWAQASAEASSLGGHLVTINDAAEETELRQLFGDGEFWLGLNDSDADNTYAWSTGETVTYTNWNAGSPNPNQVASLINLADASNWTSDDGNALKRGIIEIGIEGELQSTGTTIVPNGDGFDYEVIAAGFSQGLAFAEVDDAIFVAEKAGKVVEVRNGAITRTVIDLTAEVDSIFDRGLIGIAADPNFATNGYLYLQYTVDLTPGDDSATTAATGQLIRVTLSQDASGSYTAIPNSRVVILDGHENPDTSHSVGDVGFDNDGNLIFTWGDGGFTNEFRLKSQDVNSVNGKLFRVDPVTFEGVPDNPFYDAENPDSVASKVLALGVRNSWRFSVDEATGDIYIGEVLDEGPEEINVIRADGSNIPNLGWPYFEGDNTTTHATAPVDFEYESPFIELPHVGTADYAILGGDVYRGDIYPSVYKDRYFFGNFGFTEGNLYTSDLQGNYQQFGTSGQYPGAVDLQVGSDGHIWLLSAVTGDLRRLVFTGENVQENRSPNAAATASQTAGAGNLNVTFDSANSTDADGDDLLFAWDFDSDGVIDAIGDQALADFSEPGRTTVAMVAADLRGGNDATTVEIDVLETADPTNIALGKPTRQAGLTEDGFASRAVDGNTDEAFANDSVAQTAQVRKPLWEVDLGQSFNLNEIEVYRRGDSGTDAQLADFWVLTSDVPFTSNNLEAVRTDPNVNATQFSAVAGALESFLVDTTGRYVRIQLENEDGILSLAEVKVFGEGV